MSQDYNNPAFKKLLQKLQEESWQLELLISGFAIFGLFTAFPYIEIAATEAQNDEKIYSWIVLTVVMVSCAILIFNLLLHVILRGLWIGALGLRYVSGDIDYEELSYSQKFTKYLKKKVGSFDRYIGRLEDYCSIIFAISFLLIFYVLAFTLCIISIVLIITSTLDNDAINETIGLWIGIPLLLFFVVGTLLTFIDFLTLGWLKKKKWISRIYFPVYWVFSKITLAFLYRPLVYNFLDNKFGRRVSLALVPIYILIVFASTYSYNASNYFSDDMDSNSVIADSRNYEDALEADTFIEDAAIESKVVTNNYLKVFMLMDYDFDEYIFQFDSTLKPEDDLRGLKSRIFSNSTVSWYKRDSLRKSYIKTLNDVFTIKIDSTNFKSEFIIGESSNGQIGFETYVGIKNLTEGKHLLKVLRKRIRKKDTSQVYYSRIPFWYYPN